MFPPFIGLCGNPKSGKSEVQKILEDSYGVRPIDDGWHLRRIAVDDLGLTWEQVSTQEGKASYVEILGKRWQVRDILGSLGKKLEDLMGEHIMPHMACQGLDLGDCSYSFGSVRKTQGAYYKARGGIILGIVNPLAGPSMYDFDWFDPALVDVWITNDAQSRGLDREAGLADLAEKLDAGLTAFWSN
jgi:hypothetical protein